MKRSSNDNFWKFLIVFSIVLNAINFYFVSGLYDILSGESLDIPVSNTAGGLTGYFALGQSQMMGMIVILIILAVGYLVFKNFK